MAVLFFQVMAYDPDHFNNSNNDRFILSKGHASALLYAIWYELGKVSKEELQTYRQLKSPLEGHPTLRFPYTEAATGALGTGLSIGVGEALAARLGKQSFCTYVLLGDGEIAEGAIWEAVQIAVHYRLDNLIAIVDCNGLGQSEPVLFDHDVDRFKLIFEAFGWHAVIVDGHNIDALIQSFQQIDTIVEKPKIILAKTIKGYGLNFAQDKLGFHGKTFQENDLEIAIESLKHTFSDDIFYTAHYAWHPKLPKQKEQKIAESVLSKKNPIALDTEPISTRKACGKALAHMGAVNAVLVVLDADVKNSTYTELFEKKFPNRFFQCFIAEQNMIGMGVGFHRRGYIPFIASFAAFFSRAHDHIRMAAIGQSALRLIGSHAGVSVGEDGPSQMGLEDIALMRCLPESVVLYPCDEISTYKLVEAMTQYHSGISYMRTTRMTTPMMYDATTSFVIGGCNIIRQSEMINADVCTVVTAGVTVFEALKAYDILQKENTALKIAIIDCYSIKPLDIATIISSAEKSRFTVITVEDHYAEGGIGEAVCSALAHTNVRVFSLAVSDLPRSGTPQALLSWAKIDSHAIVDLVHKLAH
jgi:transketolase